MRTPARIALVAVVACTSPTGTAVKLPGTPPGIGFDDLRYSPGLHRVLAPGGRTGQLFLIDPQTLDVTSIGGFGAVGDYSGGHDDGPTSVDEGLGKLFVTDRTTGTLFVVDPTAAAIASQAPLGASPDYVRFVAATKELWVSEPSAERIEILSLADDGTPTPSASVAVANGPESLVIDATRGRAYTHRWQASTVAVDLKTRAVVAEWPNGCAASRGIALDEDRGWLFSGCNEGTAAVLDVAHEGRIVSTIARGSGYDVIGYAPALGHLYLAGSACGCLTIVGVSPSGALSLLDRMDAPSSTHCVTADDAGHAWVCDPDHGWLWRVDDGRGSTLQ
jgi:DNA-binding beta-propeller fold protein YncE